MTRVEHGKRVHHFVHWSNLQVWGDRVVALVRYFPFADRCIACILFFEDNALGYVGPLRYSRVNFKYTHYKTVGNKPSSARCLISLTASEDSS